MFEKIHSARYSEFRRILRTSAIITSKGAQALALLIPENQDPSAFMRAFFSYCRDKAHRPVLFINREEWLRDLQNKLGVSVVPSGDTSFQELFGADIRMFEALRSNLARVIATDGDETGPGILVVDGCGVGRNTLIKFLEYLSPKNDIWRAITPSIRTGQFIVVAGFPKGLVLIPDCVEQIEIKPLSAEDMKGAADALADIFESGLTDIHYCRNENPVLDNKALVSKGYFFDVDEIDKDFSIEEQLRLLVASGRHSLAVNRVLGEPSIDLDVLLDIGFIALTAQDTKSAEAIARMAEARLSTDMQEYRRIYLLKAEIAFISGDLLYAEEMALKGIDCETEDVRPFENILGKIAYRKGQYEIAEHYFSNARAHSKEKDKLWAMATHNLGIVLVRIGRYKAATSLLQEGVVVADAIGDVYGGGLVRRNLAVALEYQGRYSQALRYALEAVERLSRIKPVPHALLGVADLMITFGEWDRAFSLIRVVEEQGISIPHVKTLCSRKKGECLLQKGEYEAAIRHLRDALSGLETLGFCDDIRYCKARLSEALLGAGKIKDALECAKEVAEFNDRDEAGGIGRLVEGKILIGSGEWAQSIVVLEKARQAFQSCQQREPLAQTLHLLGEALNRLGDRTGLEVQKEAEAIVREIIADIPQEHAKSFIRKPVIREIVNSDQDDEGRQEVTLDKTIAMEKPLLRHLLPNIVGESLVLRRTLIAIERVRNVNFPILLVGESGTGKELMAEAIHKLSPQAKGRFVRINAGAFTESLLMSELFGHEKGAFTGAHTRKIGCFEAAHLGTLFLDEIGEISERVQVALLRVIETQTFERVGGVEPVHVSVRLVFATNKDLQVMVKEGRFREDLYHRISGIVIRVPPLRERVEDIPALVHAFVEEIARETGKHYYFTEDAIQLLKGYQWPGNIRELKNVVRKVCVLGGTPNITKDIIARIAPEVRGGRKPKGMLDVFDMVFGRGMSLFDARREIEVALIKEALSQTNGNISAAAQILGMKRPRLSQLVHEYGLKIPENRGEVVR